MKIKRTITSMVTAALDPIVAEWRSDSGCTRWRAEQWGSTVRLLWGMYDRQGQPLLMDPKDPEAGLLCGFPSWLGWGVRLEDGRVVMVHWHQGAYEGEIDRDKELVARIRAELDRAPRPPAMPEGKRVMVFDVAVRDHRYTVRVTDGYHVRVEASGIVACNSLDDGGDRPLPPLWLFDGSYHAFGVDGLSIVYEPWLDVDEWNYIDGHVERSRNELVWTVERELVERLATGSGKCPHGRPLHEPCDGCLGIRAQTGVEGVA